MNQKYFRVPFAQSGDRQELPDDKTADGSVSFSEGWGEDYERDLYSDTKAKAVERRAMNAVLNSVTSAIKHYQTTTYPEWVSSADNAGAPLPYDVGVVVKHGDKFYLSLVENNTAMPGTSENWQPYIQREASKQEAIAGLSSTSVITPRRLKDKTDIIESEIGRVSSAITRVGNLQVAAVNTAATPTMPGRATLTVPASVIQVLIIGHYEAIGVESRNVWTNELYANGMLINRRDFSGWVSGSKGHAHYRVESLPFSMLVDLQLAEGSALTFEHKTNWGRGANAVFSIFYIQGATTKKADQPTGVIVTPATATINAGSSVNFATTVLPAEIAHEYPVTWSVSDPLLGSIGVSGQYVAKAGKNGTQSIIASVATGLAATATVTQHVYLESVDIGAVPSELIVGKTYKIPVNCSPATYTEALIASSSDSTTAFLSQDGTLTISDVGKVVLTLAGASSGVKDSITITTKAAPEDEKYLRISNTLSEFSQDEELQTKARENLGLGELATKSDITAKDVSAVFIADDVIGAGTDLDDITAPGEYYQNVTSNATLALNYPVLVAGALKVYRTGVDDNGCRQVYMPYNSTAEYRRFAFGDPLVFSAWELY
ncbi:pyocin knob domain-containing protein [Serratia microhaemolytica]|uniref:pyocin knob domain-containing protein n=1 Tax=Serratia microhaemolytica TaxID=2675110 RepID=UPI000FDE4707|nr:pyocin knob domain-containing protein [Serratia microhaemolytica]